MDDQQDTRDGSMDGPPRAPWLMLVRSFRIATGLQVLLLAAAGGLATTAGWRFSERIFLASEPDTGAIERDVRYFGSWPGARDAETCPWDCAWLEGWQQSLGHRPPADPVLTVPYRFVAPFAHLLNPATTWRASGYYLSGGVWTLFVWSIFGSAISRIAAMQFGRDERIELRVALDHARSKVVAHLAAVLLPLVGVMVLALPVVMTGLVMRIGIGAAVAGFLWFIVLAIALAMAVIVIGWLFGWPLMWGAINTESSDSFDAISRSYAYAFQRPLAYLWYALVAAAVGMLGWGLVWIVSTLVVDLSEFSASLGAGKTRMAELLAATNASESLNGPSWMGARMLSFWIGAVYTLASAYAYSYFFVAASGVYLLLRRDVDATEIDRIHDDTDGDAAFGLPPLKEDESGVAFADPSETDDAE